MFKILAKKKNGNNTFKRDNGKPTTKTTDFRTLRAAPKGKSVLPNKNPGERNSPGWQHKILT
ncbi:hypothetical protein [Candidatus Avelusimicrobium sp.]|uniref:hypothetical protein n=1 Tax=Candidatus Avelusimicrobium sp. TaxID=3048833 RepID=UPI003F7EA3A2